MTFFRELVQKTVAEYESNDSESEIGNYSFMNLIGTPIKGDATYDCLFGDNCVINIGFIFKDQFFHLINTGFPFCVLFIFDNKGLSYL